MEEQKKDEMLQGKKEWKYYPTKFTLTIRVLIGGYLVYTAYQLFQSIMETTESRDKYFLGAFMAAFMIIGIVLICYSGFNLMKGRYEGGPGDLNEQSEEAQEEEQFSDVLPQSEQFQDEEENHE